MCVCVFERERYSCCVLLSAKVPQGGLNTYVKKNWISKSFQKMITIFLLEKNGISSREYLVGEHKGLSY